MDAAIKAIFGFIGSYWWVLPIILSLVFYKVFLAIFGIVIIGETEIGIVNKKFCLGAKGTLPDGKIIALNGEAGFQADTLGPGMHFWKFFWQYEIKRVGFIQIGQSQLGLIRARDGNALNEGHVLGKKIECDSFQSARLFLESGGQRGAQMDILKPGNYRINTALFDVVIAAVTEIGEGMVGIVSTKDGKPLDTDDIAGIEIEGHNSFQDGQMFIDGGGYRGLQVQVLKAGRYFLNEWFVTVKQVEMTSVPIAHVGVVIYYAGKEGKDVSGEEFKHANLVAKGDKGVWIDTLDPGRYPLNTDICRVVNVPTANIVLNWADARTESHKLDANLSTIKVRSADGFTFTLDVSQIIHIPHKMAPMVIARFGTVENMVTQVLEPTIGNYFRNAAQISDAISFLKERTKRQEEAKTAIKEALVGLNIEAVDTLIGDIVPPEELMKILMAKKIATQQQDTFVTQQAAENARQSLEQSRALADTQKEVVAAERKVAIAEFNANARIKEAEGEAKAKTVNADADAEVLTKIGDATANKIKAVGQAEADVIEQKIQTLPPEMYTMIEVWERIKASGQPLVPLIVMGGDGASSPAGGLMGLSLTEKVTGKTIAELNAKTPATAEGGIKPAEEPKSADPAPVGPPAPAGKEEGRPRRDK